MKLPESSIKKIAVFRALQLGDMLNVIPAVRALRNAYPLAEITLLGLPWAKSLISRFPSYFNNFIHFPGYPGLPEQLFDARAFLDFLSVMQKERYDLALQMQGNGNLVNPMVELFGSTYTAGFFYKNVYYPDNGLFVEYPEDCHEVGRHLRLIQHLGINTTGNHLEFPLYEADFNELERLDLPVKPGQYVCVHPGSRGAWRQWPPENFAMLADRCGDVGLKIVVTGTKEELDLVKQVTDLMHHESIVVAGKTSLGAVAVLIKNASILISNCTGVSHISAALKTPSIVISMDGEPERWGPLDHELHRTIDWTRNTSFNNVENELQHLLSIYGNVDERRDKIGIVTIGNE